MADPLLREKRRFTALLACHPQVSSVKDLRELLTPQVTKGRSVRVSAAPEWDVQRCEFLYRRSLYPERTIAPESRQRGDYFAHEVYIAGRRLPGLGGFVTIVASPYVRLLNLMASTLKAKVPQPAPRFVAVDIAAAIKDLARNEQLFSVNVVTLQMLTEPMLQLVSLAGQNPLNSKLHAALHEVTAPYALRAEFPVKPPSRVNVDRHGNVWWYQAGEQRFASPVTLIDYLDRIGALRLSLRLPLVREEGED